MINGEINSMKYYVFVVIVFEEFLNGIIDKIRKT